MAFMPLFLWFFFCFFLELRSRVQTGSDLHLRYLCLLGCQETLVYRCCINMPDYSGAITGSAFHILTWLPSETITLEGFTQRENTAFPRPFVIHLFRKAVWDLSSLLWPSPDMRWLHSCQLQVHTVGASDTVRGAELSFGSLSSLKVSGAGEMIRVYIIVCVCACESTYLTIYIYIYICPFTITTTLYRYV